MENLHEFFGQPCMWHSQNSLSMGVLGWGGHRKKVCGLGGHRESIALLRSEGGAGQADARWLRHSLSTPGRVWATLGCGAPACPAGSCITEITGGESSSRLSLILPTPHPSSLPSWLRGDQHSRLNPPAPSYCAHTSYPQTYHRHPKASQNTCKSPFNTLQRQRPSRSSLNTLP